MAKKGLGKGFDAFFEREIKEISETNEATHELKITEIEPNRKQPRKKFDEEKIEVLAESIKEHGLIQPIVVIKNRHGLYSIVAGERRWRAAKKAGLKTVPVAIKDYSEEEAAQIALIENLQREDLNAIEEAQGYRSLMDEYEMTQEEISKNIGKSRSAIANSLRLLTLDNKIQTLVIEGKISGGHARAVLSVPDSEGRAFLAQKIIDEELNVRQAEAIAKQMLSRKPKPKTAKKSELQIELEALSGKLSESFGTRVKIQNGAKKGKIEIEYYNNEDLDRILSMFKI